MKPCKYPRLRASFTVEASLLLPPVLAVLLLILYLFAHVHSRSVLTAYACEQSVTGKEQSVNVIFLTQDVSKEGSSDKKKREVSYHFRTAPMLSYSAMEETVRASYEIADPAAFARRAAAVRDLISGE